MRYPRALPWADLLMPLWGDEPKVALLGFRPERGNHMPAQVNALGALFQQQLCPVRAEHRHSSRSPEFVGAPGD